MNSRKSLGLFLLVGVLWGVPYLFIKIAVAEFSTPMVVFSRVLIGALILLPIAIKQGAIAPAKKYWKLIVVYAILEMVGPWYLITTAEKSITSGLAGLLIATVPIWATLLASASGDTTVWHSKRLFGLVIGFIGVFALVGVDALHGATDLAGVLMVLLSAFLYAFATNMISTKAPEVPGIAISGISMAITAVIFAVPAALTFPTETPSLKATSSLIGLGAICTAAAFYYFFKLLAQVGSARASVVTYVNTAVAIGLGVILIDEPLTLGIFIGFPLVLVGSYLASRKNLPVTTKSN